LLATGRHGKKNTLPVIVAIAIILMMGNSRALPMAHAFSGVTAYNADFSRTACGDLSSPITARFGPDISGGNSSSDTMTIKEVGGQSPYGTNNGTGDFKFDQAAEGTQHYASNPQAWQYPSTEAFADFHGYVIGEIHVVLTEPANGTSNTYTFINATSAASYSGNFSSTTSTFEIHIVQTSSPTYAIIAEFYIISSGGSVLDSWNLYEDLSGYSAHPPYQHQVAVDELAGLEKKGYATYNAGTDFQIESVIPLVTDFTNYAVQTNTGNQPESTSPCVDWYPDDEGGGTGTWGSEHYSTNTNEAYQYLKVTA
jgi:hypothetical protein